MTLSHLVDTTTHSFFFSDPPPTNLYTLSLHDALPISTVTLPSLQRDESAAKPAPSRIATIFDRMYHDNADRMYRFAQRLCGEEADADRKSTRLNSSHPSISYAVFCLKKKNKRL